MTRLLLAFVLAMSAPAEGALAQSFPERPITLINPYAAGGPADLLARTVAEGMSETLGRPVVVENRAGAGTAIGARAVAQAKPDGYTLFIGGSPSHVITPALMKDAATTASRRLRRSPPSRTFPTSWSCRRAAPTRAWRSSSPPPAARPAT